jgi:hypothetical protein
MSEEKRDSFILYRIAIEEFEKEFKSANAELAEWEKINHYQRDKLIGTSEDIIGFSKIFSDIHLSTKALLIKDTQLMSENFGSLKFIQERSQSKEYKSLISNEEALKVAYKGYFYFIRAFQDAVYGVLLNLLDENIGQSMKGMKKALKDSSPVNKWILEIDGYKEWFLEFREKRNKIKIGVRFNIRGPQWDPGVGFSIPTKDGGTSSGTDSVKIMDLIKAIDMSAEALKLIRQKLKDV